MYPPMPKRAHLYPTVQSIADRARTMFRDTTEDWAVTSLCVLPVVLTIYLGIVRSLDPVLNTLL
ncbi:hypothetical protein EV356DRAFT_500246 [Viridothelium virens]|uniref:Uncharacterized protein n=1 Tax=Viridothelium virens TaxID=1048519 RepID=A0A6A6HC17_VIRVR|nr:hypothetical protein EV356DRAFT_500246 [Viridothelium virens]